MKKQPLITANQLKEIVKSENVVLLDTTIAPVGSNQQPISEFIPGSVRFDFDHEICDQLSDLPHMLPTPSQFAHQVSALGISNDSRLVVYDRVGMFAAPRAWWMFRIMGHDHIQVLDGGLPAWKMAGFEVTEYLNQPSHRGVFTPLFRPQMLASLDEVKAALSNDNSIVLDARSKGRFSGKEPEPRPNLRSGHMPGAINLPYTQVLNEGVMKSGNELSEVFSAHDSKRVIFSCGSGVTACILALAAEVAGTTDWSVYDGSWAEWGRVEARLPIVSD